MFRNALLILAAASAIVGCATPTVLPPEVRVPASSAAIFLPVVEDQWIGGLVQLAVKNKNGCGQFAGNILPDPIDDDYLVEIEANRDIFFNITRTDGKTECSKVGLFYASMGNEYIVKFTQTNKQCEFSLIEKTPSGAQKKIITYPSHVSMVDALKVCENKSKLY